MGQARLCNLAFLNVERERKTENDDFADKIDKFASVKARKMKF